MKLLLFSLLTAFSLSAHAAMTCEALVTHLTQLRADFQALRYDDQAEQDRGYDREDEAISPIHDFDAIPKTDACRARAWHAFVDLAQAQSPFDGESRAAELISKRLTADKSLQAGYDDSIKRFSDRCRSQNLSTSVRYRICLDREHKSEEHCNNEIHFNYLKCIGMKDR